jgi:hypothetical protein
MAKTKVSAESNIYTGLLGLAALALTAATVYVIFMASSQYDTIYKVVEAAAR